LLLLLLLLLLFAGYPYEESIRVPLVIVDPRMPVTMHGTRNEEFTLSIDLAPTMLSAANIAVPKVMQGRDMAPLYLDPVPAAASWRQEFYYEFFTGAKGTLDACLALVRKSAKYILWPEWDYEELFRLDNDPFEEQNIFESTLQTSKEFLDEMKTRFEELKVAAAAGLPL
jgi:arylsulfatase